MYAEPMVKRATSALVFLLLALLPAAASAAEHEAAKRTRAAKKLRLESFDSCAGLIRYGRRYAPRGPGAGPPLPFAEGLEPQAPPLLRSPEGGPVPITLTGVEDTAAGGSEGCDTGTNVQEAGLD